MPDRSPVIRRSSRRRLLRPALAAAALGGVAGAALVERRHLRAISADEEFLALSAPLGGRPLAAVISADGTALHAERFGPSDAPLSLVLAHGWTEAIPFWGAVIRQLLARDLSVVAYDLRGHGKSEPARGGDYALERFGEDLEAVLVAAGADPAHTTVAGHSLGAMSIAAWAAAFDVDARVGATALVNTGLSDLIGGALIFGELGSRLAPEWVGRGVLGSGRPMLPVSTPISHAAVRHTAFGPDAGDGAIAFYERMLTRTEPSARAATGIALSTLDLTAAVARITVPTLVLAGDRDRLTPPAHAHRIYDALPHPLRLVVLERTGHMSPLERPHEVSALLEELVAAAAPGAAALS